MIKHHIAFNPTVDWRFDLAKAEGALLWDTHQKQYIDFSSAWNVTNLGWNNQEIKQAIIEQAQKNVYTPMWAADKIQIRYAQELTNSLPAELDVICRATGGTEANEMAIKIARVVTGKKTILGFSRAYHGQSFATLSLSVLPRYIEKIKPLVPDIIQIEYPDAYRTNLSADIVLDQFLVSLEQQLQTNNVAALFTEPGITTGGGSLSMAPEKFLRSVRALTKKYGTLLVIDEVGTGFSRTGKLFGIEHDGIVPDIITLAKGISNGAAAIGATVTKSMLIKEHIGFFKPTSTFGWTSIACAASLKTLEIHQRDTMWEVASKKGAWLLNRLKKELADHPNVAHIRGLGLELGIDIVKNKQTKEIDQNAIQKIQAHAFKQGLHLAPSRSCIQIMPPLTIPNDILQQGADILINTIKNLR